MQIKLDYMLAILVSSFTTLSQAGNFSLYTGANYSTGKYGSDISTDIIYIPVTGKYEVNNTSVKLTVPWISIKGAGGVTNADSPILIGTSTNTITTESGLGDVIGSVTQSFVAWDSHPLYIDLTGKVKLATASESKGLGTGENDYAILVDAYKPFSDVMTLFGGIGYKVFGDPSWVNFNNVWSANIGTSYVINQKLSAGILGDIRQATLNNTEPLREMTLFSAYKLSNHYKLQSYVTTGYSKTSSDFGCGFMLKKNF
jgi:hypothetical protein